MDSQFSGCISILMHVSIISIVLLRGIEGVNLIILRTSAGILLGPLPLKVLSSAMSQTTS